ncbi:MAG: hypothetical protein Q9187_005849 [Circinaria calcarea]
MLTPAGHDGQFQLFSFRPFLPTLAVHLTIGLPNRPGSFQFTLPVHENDDEPGEFIGCAVIVRLNGDVVHIRVRERFRAHAIRFRIETCMVEDEEEDGEGESPTEVSELVRHDNPPTIQRSELTMLPQDDLRDQVLHKDGDAESVYVLATELPGGTTLAAMDLPSRSLLQGMNFS